MSCPYCESATTIKHYALFQADCHGCKVRAVASGPALFDAIKSNTLTPRYRSELQANFKDWKAAHEEVKAEHKRLEAMK